MKELRRLGRAMEKALCALPPDYAAAAEIIERIAINPLAGQAFYLPELFEQLADCYANMHRFDEAIGAMKRALATGWEGCPDGRCRIAELLLRAGRADEAHALYAAVRADTPEDVWLYNAAGVDYGSVGDHERALGWLSEGLVLCLTTGDPERLAEQLSDLREESLASLGCGPDALQERAKQFLAEREKRLSGRQPGFDLHVSQKQDGTRCHLVNAVVAVGWFPAGEFQAAIERWPFLAESWGAQSYEEYCRQVQRHLLSFGGLGLRPNLAPIRVDEYVRWSKSEGLDPGTSQARSQYAAVIASRGESVTWPPGRNDPCWCGSGRKYKKCCGTVAPAAVAARVIGT